MPLLEFSVIYEDSFDSEWPGVYNGKLSAKQMDLYHAPYMDVTTRFPWERQFATVDFHFKRELLETYATDFPML